MDAKTKSIINIVVASFGVLAFILFVIAMVKTFGFLNDNAFIMDTNKDGTIKNVSDEAWKVIHNGGDIKGAKEGMKWGGSNTGDKVKDVMEFKNWLATNVSDIKDILSKGKLEPYQIDSLVLQGGKYQGTVGIIEIILIAWHTPLISGLLITMGIVSLISWIAGIITSILVKKARKELGIVSGGANVIFAIVRITGVPFLITSIMSYIAISKSTQK